MAKRLDKKPTDFVKDDGKKDEREEDEREDSDEDDLKPAIKKDEDGKKSVSFGKKDDEEDETEPDDDSDKEDDDGEDDPKDDDDDKEEKPPKPGMQDYEATLNTGSTTDTGLPRAKVKVNPTT